MQGGGICDLGLCRGVRGMLVGGLWGWEGRGGSRGVGVGGGSGRWEGDRGIWLEQGVEWGYSNGEIFKSSLET